MQSTQRETMEVDVLFVGAGIANLAAAYALQSKIGEFNRAAAEHHEAPLLNPMVLAIDKGAQVGSHALSGAVVDPISFKALFPGIPDLEFPFFEPVASESIRWLSKSGDFAVPGALVPRELHNSGCYLASLGEVTRWMAEKCEELGVEVYTEFAASELMREGDTIIGARIADKRLDAEGKPAEGYTPGMDVLAKVTVLGEGTRGFLSQRLIADFGLDAEANPQVWGLGVKELIEIHAGRIANGSVIHTMGYPLDWATYGGGFIYALSDTLLSLGLVIGLDCRDPWLSAHEAFLKFKSHPMVASLIKGGKVLEYGAKTLPEGGYYAMPKLAVDGAVLVGDSAGMINGMRLKGIHLAIHSGMLAAERIFQALQTNDFSRAALDYRPEFEAGWAGAEMRRARNFRQSFHGGLIPGMVSAGLHMVSGGKLPAGRKSMPPDYAGMRKAAGAAPRNSAIQCDQTLMLDIETDVFMSGALHREDQAPHCRIVDPQACVRCDEDYAAPCTRFCPAKVYERKVDSEGKFAGIHVSFSNCLHCKTCEIKDPLQNLRWHLPEGGDGPKYKRM